MKCEFVIDEIIGRIVDMDVEITTFVGAKRSLYPEWGKNYAKNNKKAKTGGGGKPTTRARELSLPTMLFI